MTSLTRRSFLHSAGATALVFKVAESGPYIRAAGPNDHINLGHIGVGIQGSILLRAFKSIAGVRNVVAADIYDGHLEHAREMTEGTIETTKDYRAVLDRKDVDAVVIATPDHWHCRMVLDALEAGKHVYCEKPLTWSIAEGKEIIATAHRTGKLVQVGSQAKTSTLTAKARELITSGALGKITMIRMSNNRNSPEGAWVYPIPPDASTKTIDWERFIGSAPKRSFDPAVFFRWRCWWEYSGGVATDLFVHLLTTLHEFMAVRAPSSVVSHGGLYHWKDGRTVPDVMNSLFEYPEGFLVDMYVNLANSRPVHGTVVMGTEGTLVFGRREAPLTLYPEPWVPPVQHYGSSAWPAAVRTRYFEAAGYDSEGRSKTPPPEPREEKAFTIERGPSHYEHFIISLRENTPSREDAVEGHYAAAGAHLANLAYREGRRVSWDAATGVVS